MQNISIDRLRRFHSDARRLHAGLMEVGERHRRAHERRNDARLELERFEDALPNIPASKKNSKVGGVSQDERTTAQHKALRGKVVEAEESLSAIAAEQESQSENWQLAKRLADTGVRFCREHGVLVPADIREGY